MGRKVSITLYSDKGAMSDILRRKLDYCELEYTEVDVEQFQGEHEPGEPVMVVRERVMEFITANKWLNRAVWKKDNEVNLKGTKIEGFNELSQHN